MRSAEEYGYQTGLLQVSGRSSRTHNAAQIKDGLLRMDLLFDEKVVLIGYSKGTPDILEALGFVPAPSHYSGERDINSKPFDLLFSNLFSPNSSHRRSSMERETLAYMGVLK